MSKKWNKLECEALEKAIDFELVGLCMIPVIPLILYVILLLIGLV